MLVLHVLFATAVWWEMRPRPVRESVPVQLDSALQVRLIAPPHAPVPAAPMAPPLRPPPQRALRPPQHERMSGDAMKVSLPPAPAPAPAPVRPRLFDRTGQPLLPASAGSNTAAVPGYVQRMPQGDAQVMHTDDPVKYHATRFESYFPSPGQTALGHAVRRVLDATHTGEHKQVNLPRGVHLQCKTVLGLPTPDCTMPPAPPSKKDGDERLDMAPPPLAKALAPPRRSDAACIASYRAGKPLPHGCPVDTPARAVDAECIEQFREGKPLAAHCPPDTAKRAAGAAVH